MLRTCQGNSSACRHSDNWGLYFCVLLMVLSSVSGDYLLVTEVNRVAASIITSGWGDTLDLTERAPWPEGMSVVCGCLPTPGVSDVHLDCVSCVLWVRVKEMICKKFDYFYIILWFYKPVRMVYLLFSSKLRKCKLQEWCWRFYVSSHLIFFFLGGIKDHQTLSRRRTRNWGGSGSAVGPRCRRSAWNYQLLPFPPAHGRRRRLWRR